MGKRGKSRSFQPRRSMKSFQARRSMKSFQPPNSQESNPPVLPTVQTPTSSQDEGQPNVGITPFKALKAKLDSIKGIVRRIIFFLFCLTIVIFIFMMTSDHSNSIFSNFVIIIGIILALLSIEPFYDSFEIFVCLFIVFLWFAAIRGIWKYKQRIWNVISIMAIVFFLLGHIPWFRDEIHVLCFSHIGWQPICGNALSTETLFARDPNNPKLGSTITVGITDGSNPLIFDPSLGNVEQDIIAKIHQENENAVKSTYMDLVAVTTVSRTSDDLKASVSVGVADLRGDYLAIHAYNLNHKIKVRLLIANVGTLDTVDTAVPLVMDQILLLSRQDTALRGIIGLPFSQATSYAVNGDWKIYQSKIPMISSSATSNDFSNIPLFYRISSSDKQQVCTIVKGVINKLEPVYKQKYQKIDSPFTIAVFYDQSNSYSSSLEQSFQGIVTKDPRYPSGCFGDATSTNIRMIFEKITLNNSNTYSLAINDSVAQNADMIFFAGYASNLNDFEAQLESAQVRHHQTYHLPIVGGDGLFDIAGNITNAYSRVYSAVYASPVNENSKELSELYEKDFKSLQSKTSPLLPPHAILSFDATTAFLTALDDSHPPSGQLPGQDDFNSALATVGFPGASGQVQLQGNNPTFSSDPIDKTIYIMCEDTNFSMHEMAEDDPGEKTIYIDMDILQCKPK